MLGVIGSKGKLKMADLMPHEQPEKRTTPMTDEELLRMFGHG